ncbi:hypothetical protein [Gilvimarinus chinensis]|uniref:hypothetical protein n=1 Tax=Gilvimarinus chinensis TaxID=396005 RepID=UPI0003825BA7|nr:hypothetical protein [Gilvimarinus chinensis]
MFQTNRPEGETSLFGFPLVDSVSDLPGFLGGNYNQGEGGSLGGSIISLPKLFTDDSAHSNYICQTAACTKEPELMPSAVQTFRDGFRTPGTDGGGYIRPEIFYPPRPASGDYSNQYQWRQTSVNINESSDTGRIRNSNPDLEQLPRVQQLYQYPEHNIGPKDNLDGPPIDLTLHVAPEGGGQRDQDSEKRQITLPERVDEAAENHGESADE